MFRFDLVSFVRDWQTLLGTIIGASTPVLFWFFIQWRQNHKRNKEDLIYLEKLIISNINNAIDAGETIRDFIDNRLSELLINIEKRNGTDKYSAEYAFFPLFATHPAEGDVLNIHTPSGYLNNKILQIHKMSQDFSFIIDDLRRQFKDTVELNREMVFRQLNGGEAQRIEYRENIKRYIDMIEKDFFDKTLKVYLNVLAQARATVNTIFEIGYFGWSNKFEPHFRYFRNKKELAEFRIKSFYKIDEFLKENVERQLKEFESSN